MKNRCTSRSIQMEAVRAGPAGRGFTIVADEMRRLSARVTGNAAEVSKLVAAVREATENVRKQAGANIEVAATGHARSVAALDSLGGIIAAVQETTAAAKQISHATRQQMAETATAATKVTELSEEVRQVASGTEQARAAAERAASVSIWMERLVQRFFT